MTMQVRTDSPIASRIGERELPEDSLPEKGLGADDGQLTAGLKTSLKQLADNEGMMSPGLDRTTIGTIASPSSSAFSSLASGSSAGAASSSASPSIAPSGLASGGAMPHFRIGVTARSGASAGLQSMIARISQENASARAGNATGASAGGAAEAKTAASALALIQQLEKRQETIDKNTATNGAASQEATTQTGGTQTASAGTPTSADATDTTDATDATDATDTTTASSQPSELERQAQTVSVLQRYESTFKKAKSSDDLDKIMNDSSTPPDLKKALQDLKGDPDLQKELDSAKNGKSDGKFSGDDIKALSKSPVMVQYNRQLSQTYTNNYIPSDDGGKTTQGRAITANDAGRELYKYSDNLPKNISQKDLQDIVDGTGSEGKRPPQLVASAQYFLDHPADWQKLTGKSGNSSISRGHLEDAIEKNVQLSGDETKTIDTLQQHSSEFFGKGSLTRDKLKDLANSSDPDVAQAAKKLQNDPMLFGMLDNGKHGNSGSFWNPADDGKIGKGDLDAFVKKMNKTPAPDLTPQATSSSSAAQSPSDAAAVSAMQSGELNEPDVKKKKGGQGQEILHAFLKIFSAIEKIASKVLGFIADLKIPGLSQLAGLGAVATQAASSGLNVADTALEGGDVKKAGIEAGIDTAAAGVSALTAPGVGKGMTSGVEAAVKDAKVGYAANKSEIDSGAAKTAAKEGGKIAASEGAQQGYDHYEKSAAA